MANETRTPRVIVERAERSRKFEWFLYMNNRRICVSEVLFAERNQANTAAHRFIKFVNRTTDSKLV